MSSQAGSGEPSAHLLRLALKEFVRAGDDVAPPVLEVVAFAVGLAVEEEIHARQELVSKGLALVFVEGAFGSSHAPRLPQFSSRPLPGAKSCRTGGGGVQPSDRRFATAVRNHAPSSATG